MAHGARSRNGTTRAPCLGWVRIKSIEHLFFTHANLKSRLLDGLALKCCEYVKSLI